MIPTQAIPTRHSALLAGINGFKALVLAGLAPADQIFDPPDNTIPAAELEWLKALRRRDNDSIELGPLIHLRNQSRIAALGEYSHKALFTVYPYDLTGTLQH
jgi:hypothetical protein